MDSALLTVLEYAKKAHGEQKRKYIPEPYIVHPIRVMHICKEYTSEGSVLAAALLHDVLEDTPITEQELLSFLYTVLPTTEARKTLRFVIELTDVYTKHDFPQWNRRTRKSKELERLQQISASSQTIKYADILDNATEIVEHDKGFSKVLLNEYKGVLTKLDKGDSVLHRKVITFVEEKITTLNMH
jgi:guanosine-3',5'-bis(diphosphate) 3'-pyrophosphohydrolase